jgi:GrpB-like predicted nucleotidyltransferase (UPF0157 family)
MIDIFRFLPYDPEFPELFALEKQRLQTRVPEAVTIEHFGSTAVPGLGGKGIIDIYVLVPRRVLYEASEKVQGLGYIYDEDGGLIDERLFHRWITEDKVGRPRIYHLHLSYEGYSDFTHCLAFRDYLCTHPEAAQQYATAKQMAAVAAAQQPDRSARRQAYVSGKERMLLAILSKALLSP